MRTGWEPIGCAARTHLILVDSRFLRWRCVDRNCPDVVEAKRRGAKAYHVKDLIERKQWTEYESDDRPKE